MISAGSLVGQTPGTNSALPDAPKASLVLLAQQASAPMTQPVGQTPSTPSDSAAPGDNPRLTLSDAEKIAIKNNPRVSVARLLAMAQHQVMRETRSAELPTANAAITAVQAEDASRISAGSLTASRLFTHAGAGGGFTQLITDFGKTSNLVAVLKASGESAKCKCARHHGRHCHCHRSGLL
jgi:outer membrane protein